MLYITRKPLFSDARKIDKYKCGKRHGSRYGYIAGGGGAEGNHTQ